MTWIDSLVFNDQGLVAAIAQDIETGAVLMLAWMNRTAIDRTIETGFAHFWSRSRNELWKKGETSGNELHVEEIRVDCDHDSLLLRVKPLGPACHTGHTSCFFHRADASDELHKVDDESHFSAVGILQELSAVIRSRREASSDTSYTARLLAGNIERIAKKVGEEAFETVLAAATQSDTRLAEETADLLYHLLVLLEARGLTLDDACNVLASRRLG